jgi:F-type H+-transporting ATPase subunit epsilon
MRLEILLPYRVFAEWPDVTRIVVETLAGSIGILPRRLDFTVGLLPGVLTYQRAGREEEVIAVDAGILVKAGNDVRMSVRAAVGGADLGGLRDAVRSRYIDLDETERTARSAIARLESDFVRRFTELKRGR